jgi:hypothetical protein
MVRNMHSAAAKCQRCQAATFETVVTSRQHRIFGLIVGAAARQTVALVALACAQYCE